MGDRLDGDNCTQLYISGEADKRNKKGKSAALGGHTVQRFGATRQGQREALRQSERGIRSHGGGGKRQRRTLGPTVTNGCLPMARQPAKLSAQRVEERSGPLGVARSTAIGCAPWEG